MDDNDDEEEDRPRRNSSRIFRPILALGSIFINRKAISSYPLRLRRHGRPPSLDQHRILRRRRVFDWWIVWPVAYWRIDIVTQQSRSIPENPIEARRRRRIRRRISRILVAYPKLRSMFCNSGHLHDDNNGRPRPRPRIIHNISHHFKLFGTNIRTMLFNQCNILLVNTMLR